jgi:formamidase
MSIEPYLAAACQVDQPNPVNRIEMRRNTAHMLRMVDHAVLAHAPLGRVRLVVFPEFAHSAPVYLTSMELREKLAVEIPNEHTEKLHQKAKQWDLYIQSGSMLESDPAWPNVVFNTTCLIGPEGILYKYRKVNPWVPWEVHSSPHDLAGYQEDLFPVAKTPIGNIGVAICYDWLFPEAIRQLAANGAEILVRVSAYMDPWGSTEPMDWWTVVNRCRAMENMAYVVAANQGASLQHYPPFSWPGGSMIVDFDGRIVTQASPGAGERIVVAPIYLESLRHERRARRMHHMLPHLRSEAYPMYRKSWYPSGAHTNLADVTTSAQEALTDQAKRSARILSGQEASPSENIESLVQKMDFDQTER